MSLPAHQLQLVPPLNLPPFLSKAFKDEFYAEEFISKGRFRMWSLEYFKRIEDAQRRDSNEGKLLTVDAKGVHHHRNHINQKFLFCMSRPEIDEPFRRKRFGNFVVRIHDPERFVRDIDAYLRTSSHFEKVMALECLPVTYGASDDSLYDAVGDPLVYSSKPSAYKEEHEQRIVLMGTGEAFDLEFLDLDLGGPLIYLERSW